MGQPKQNKGIKNLKPWKRGQSGNPAGRPPIPEEIRKLRALTNEQVAEVGTLLLESKESDVQKIADDANAPLLKKWIAAVAIAGLKNKDERKLDTLLTRISGKPPEKTEIEGKLTLEHLVMGSQKEEK